MTLLVYGARCVWWGSIKETARINGTLPCCPHCRSVLFQLPSEDEWWEGVDRHEANGHPGYRDLIEWSRGKHFFSMREMAKAYAEETRKEVTL